MIKHAYMIMAHDQFELLSILIKMLDDPRNDIFLHIDKKAKDFKAEEYMIFLAETTVKNLFIFPKAGKHWRQYQESDITTCSEVNVILFAKYLRKQC